MAEHITPSASSSATTSLESEQVIKQQEKMNAIRFSLQKLEEAEEEAMLQQRIAANIQLAKEKKAFPERFQQKPPMPIKKSHKKKKKRTKRQILRDLFPKRGDGFGETMRKCIFWISILVFGACLVLIGQYLLDLWKSKNLYEQIGNSYHQATTQSVTEQAAETEENLTSETATESTTEAKHYTKMEGAASLLEINPEVAGYISIPDTEVDYPLMQHPNDVEGDEYYLYRDLYGNHSQNGSIFLDSRCNFDVVGEDGTLAVPNSDNLIIYGHNMRDRSMFGSLRDYQNDASYYDAHPLIFLNSNYETYVFKIYAYFIADAEDTTETRFDYWNRIEFADETAFYNYVNEVKRRTLRNTNIDVQYGDQLLTLSTCNSAFQTARLVICARMVREGEDPYEGTTGSTPNTNIKWPSVYYLGNENTYDPNAPFIPYGP
ncbi:MAG: class B sortase [Oscillospiraceae bacterium]|nr:class B sortase [Oscillospiraceae bacterium]